MDILDNVIFSVNSSPGTGDYIADPPIYVPAAINPQAPQPRIFAYNNNDKMEFASFPDVAVVQRGLMRHWFEVTGQLGRPGGLAHLVRPFVRLFPYHIIYAYLLESTRVLQIFEKVFEKYFQDEELGIANPPNQQAFQWMINSESLFYRENRSPYNLRSVIRPSAEATRRNAYYRLFGMELPFEDQKAGASSFYKAKASNLQFVVLFEQYLSEIWQGLINARNTSGANTTDVINICTLAQRMRELLTARRGLSNNYQSQNLSYEEYVSVFQLNWFSFVLSYNSPVSQFLGCESNTFGESLIKLGIKVGIQAHRKSQALFELATPAAIILRTIEQGVFLETNPTQVRSILGDPTAPAATPNQVYYRNLFLTVINNWEKATGHKIKNRESNINGTVKIAQIARGSLVTN